MSTTRSTGKGAVTANPSVPNTSRENSTQKGAVQGGPAPSGSGSRIRVGDQARVPVPGARTGTTQKEKEKEKEKKLGSRTIQTKGPLALPLASSVGLSRRASGDSVDADSLAKSSTGIEEVTNATKIAIVSRAISGERMQGSGSETPTLELASTRMSALFFDITTKSLREELEEKKANFESAVKSLEDNKDVSKKGLYMAKLNLCLEQVITAEKRLIFHEQQGRGEVTESVIKEREAREEDFMAKVKTAEKIAELLADQVSAETALSEAKARTKEHLEAKKDRSLEGEVCEAEEAVCEAEVIVCTAKLNLEVHGSRQDRDGKLSNAVTKAQGNLLIQSEILRALINRNNAIKERDASITDQHSFSRRRMYDAFVAYHEAILNEARSRSLGDEDLIMRAKEKLEDARKEYFGVRGSDSRSIASVSLSEINSPLSITFPLMSGGGKPLPPIPENLTDFEKNFKYEKDFQEEFMKIAEFMNKESEYMLIDSKDRKILRNSSRTGHLQPDLLVVFKNAAQQTSEMDILAFGELKKGLISPKDESEQMMKYAEALLENSWRSHVFGFIANPEKIILCLFSRKIGKSSSKLAFVHSRSEYSLRKDDFALHGGLIVWNILNSAPHELGYGLKLIASIRTKVNVLRMLGQGAQGGVYEVSDGTSPLTMAMKVPLEGQANLDNIERERKILKDLEENGVEGIPKVFNKLGELDLTDASFKECLFLLPIGTHQGLGRRIALEFVDILSNIHDRGYLHRDVRPTNMMCSGGKALLIDFGHAIKDEPGPITFAGTLTTASDAVLKNFEGAKHRSTRSDDYVSLVRSILLILFPKFKKLILRSFKESKIQGNDRGTLISRARILQDIWGREKLEGVVGDGYYEKYLFALEAALKCDITELKLRLEDMVRYAPPPKQWS